MLVVGRTGKTWPCLCHALSISSTLSVRAARSGGCSLVVGVGQSFVLVLGVRTWAAIEEALCIIAGQENAKLHMWAADGGFRFYILLALH